MKGGLAAAIIAAEAYIERNPDFPGAIEISGTVDEESGGFGGVAYLASKGYFSKPSTRTASASAIGVSGGRKSRLRVRSRTVRCHFSAIAPFGT